MKNETFNILVSQQKEEVSLLTPNRMKNETFNILVSQQKEEVSLLTPNRMKNETFNILVSQQKGRSREKKGCNVDKNRALSFMDISALSRMQCVVYSWTK